MRGFGIAQRGVQILRNPVAVRAGLLQDRFGAALDERPFLVEFGLGECGDDEVADGQRLGLRLIESA